MSTINATKKRRFPTASSPHESDEDSAEQAASLTNKRRGSVAADFAPPRLIVSERQQMAVLKQLIAGDESNTGSHSPSSVTPQPRPSKLNRRNEHGETIVHIVARRGDIKQLRKVLKAGANVNEADNAGWTPLHEAVTKNQFKAARLLLKSGANSNAPGPEGQTPLVDAILNNNTKMAELLLTYSADPSVVDVTRLDETMSKVLKREVSVLDSSDNENDDESTSPLSPLTSDNDGEHDDKQSFHSTLVEQLDRNLAQASTIPKFQHNKPYRDFRERSSHSPDSSSPSKTRTISATNDPSSLPLTNKNPYDFESDEDDETHENSNDGEPKTKFLRKQRTNSGNSTQSNESFPMKKQANQFDSTKDSDQKLRSISDDEQLQHICRVPPLKIVLARAVLQKTPDGESVNSPTMEDDENNPHLTIDTSSIIIPIIAENEKLFSSMSTNLTRDVQEHRFNDESSSQPFQLDSESNLSLSYQSHSPSTIISNLITSMLEEIEANDNAQLTPLPIIEDDQLEIEEDDEDDEDNEDDEEEGGQDISDKSSTIKTGKEQTADKSSTSDSKPTTRTLRSHARKKPSLSDMHANNQNTRRVSNRRRALETKLLLNTTDKEKKRRTLSERLRKEKDFTDENPASSNSDDQTMESNNGRISNPNDDASSCSSMGAGDGGSSTSSSTHNPKPTNEMEFLPLNKRRLREKNTFVSTNPTEPSEDSPREPPVQTIATREIPMNGIKQFLEIRQQIDKRHETMLKEFVPPKIPKDFSETTMAKKSYLIAPAFCSYMSTTPASIGIKRYSAPSDLDPHLVEVFTKQEDERYRMKLRHQVERDKLVLSHEQEVLRLCGNATRSSVNQDIPFSYCSLLKDNEVYNNPSVQLPEKLLNNEYATTELGKRGKHRWNGRSFIKWVEDSNLKYKRLSCELNERQRLEADTVYSMQRMVWLKHLPKEASNLSLSGRSSYLLSERYLPKVEINPNFWSQWETNPF